MSEMERIRQDMGFADRERPFFIEHFWIVSIPLSLVFWFVVLFVFNWLVRLILYSIKNME